MVQNDAGDAFQVQKRLHILRPRLMSERIVSGIFKYIEQGNLFQTILWCNSFSKSIIFKPSKLPRSSGRCTHEASPLKDSTACSFLENEELLFLVRRSDGNTNLIPIAIAKEEEEKGNFCDCERDRKWLRIWA